MNPFSSVEDTVDAAAIPEKKPCGCHDKSLKGMLVNRQFMWGLVGGVVLTWGYHKFVKPLPGGGKGQ